MRRSRSTGSFKKNTSPSKEDGENSVGSGLFQGFIGLFGIQSHVHCDADDHSFYCKLSKFTSGLLQFITLLTIFIIILYFLNIFVFSKIVNKNK